MSDDTPDTEIEDADADEADDDLDLDDDDDDEAGDLSPREMLFAMQYGDVDSKNFGRRTAAAVAAGYPHARSAGLKLLRRPRVQKRLAELHRAAAGTVGKVIANLEHILHLAIQKGDLRVSARCVELQGKHLGLFTDVVRVDVPAQREYTEQEQIEGARLARLLLLEGEAADPETVEVEVAAPDADAAPAGQSDE